MVLMYSSLTMPEPPLPFIGECIMFRDSTDIYALLVQFPNKYRGVL